MQDSLESIKGCLSHLATPDSVARRRHETDDDTWQLAFGSPYAIDRDKILASKAIRRLQGKTQVVFHPKNGHVRDRLIHSLEVAQVAALGARILGLNESLCFAMALGHDLGHTPYGHTGEAFLEDVSGQKFRHEVFSVVVAQHIERKGLGLNLTHQPLRGMLRHSRGAGGLHTNNLTPEESMVMYADKIAYLFADYNDLCSRQFMVSSGMFMRDFPEAVQLIKSFGLNQRARVHTCVTALCLESAAGGEVRFRDSEIGQRFAELKAMMYRVYLAANPPDAEERMHIVYEYLMRTLPDIPTPLVFALMNDDDLAHLLRMYGDRSLEPEDLVELSVAEIIPVLRNREISYTRPDLDW